MTRNGDRPGRKLPGLSEAISYPARTLNGVSSVPPGAVSPPSSYSLTAAELARHVRSLRRAGWQHWEVKAKFDFWHAW